MTVTPLLNMCPDVGVAVGHHDLHAVTPAPLVGVAEQTDVVREVRTAHAKLLLVVGTAGFEPATPCSQISALQAACQALFLQVAIERKASY